MDSLKSAEKPPYSGRTKTVCAALLDVDYVSRGEESVIRITFKGQDDKAYEVFDESFKPYFYLIPGFGSVDPESIFYQENGKTIRPISVEKGSKMLLGKRVEVLKVSVSSAAQIPKMSGAAEHMGTAYENDIPFAKRYLINSGLRPLTPYNITLREEDGGLMLDSFEEAKGAKEIEPRVMCFDIEVYNPLGGAPHVNNDPVIMISYCIGEKDNRREGVLTFKKIDLPFVEVLKDEKEMIARFLKIVDECNVDIIVGYNSANFDIKYLLDRAKQIGIEFNMSRFEGTTKIESHGLVDKVKIGGRVHVDMYVVVKFVSIVGASESILKLNSKTLKNVYESLTGDKKFAVEKSEIFHLWDGGKKDLETLATYNMADSHALEKVYQMLVPIMFELSRLTCNSLSDVSVSTTGQLVEFMLMRKSNEFGELIPNKPSEGETRERLRNPIEGAYVKMPEPGIYENLAMFDFRGLYPSIIISYNIDPSSVCTDCAEYFEAPDGTKFDKKRKSITPILLKIMIDQRAQVKKDYKKSPDNIFLGARSTALKIVSNSFYGYLGYARSRWYSRVCAASVTAYARYYIKKCMEEAEKRGLSVIYGDTDSVVAKLGTMKKDAALSFMKEFNASLPKDMELELEDIYSRGVFVGKRTGKGDSGAKKKYALISETGRIKIRGFELVRRDWSSIARETQRAVLEAILKEGDQRKAVDIVKDAVARLRAGKVPLSELAVSTQLRKGIDGYDIKSPEIAAAKRAVKEGFKKKSEVEGAVISYVITSKGSSISDKAMLEGMAKDYDADYYINNQVIPATMKILKELNISEDELKGLGNQKKL